MGVAVICSEVFKLYNINRYLKYKDKESSSLLWIQFTSSSLLWLQQLQYLIQDIWTPFTPLHQQQNPEIIHNQVAEKVIEYLVKWTAIFLHLASCLLPKLCIINNCAFYICWCFMLCTHLLGWFPGVACIGWMTRRQMVLNARIALRTCIQHWYSCRSVCEGCEPCMDGACCLHVIFTRRT